MSCMFEVVCRDTRTCTHDIGRDSVGPGSAASANLFRTCTSVVTQLSLPEHQACCGCTGRAGFPCDEAMRKPRNARLQSLEAEVYVLLPQVRRTCNTSAQGTEERRADHAWHGSTMPTTVSCCEPLSRASNLPHRSPEHTTSACRVQMSPSCEAAQRQCTARHASPMITQRLARTPCPTALRGYWPCLDLTQLRKLKASPSIVAVYRSSSPVSLCAIRSPQTLHAAGAASSTCLSVPDPASRLHTECAVHVRCWRYIRTHWRL